MSLDWADGDTESMLNLTLRALGHPWVCTPYLRAAWCERPVSARMWCTIGPCLTYSAAVLSPIWATQPGGDLVATRHAEHSFAAFYCLQHTTATSIYLRAARSTQAYGMRRLYQLLERK